MVLVVNHTYNESLVGQLNAPWHGFPAVIALSSVVVVVALASASFVRVRHSFLSPLAREGAPYRKLLRVALLLVSIIDICDFQSSNSSHALQLDYCHSCTLLLTFVSRITMKLYAAGLNAWNQLRFDNEVLPTQPNDLYEFEVVLKGAKIKPPSSGLTYTQGSHHLLSVSLA